LLAKAMSLNASPKIAFDETKAWGVTALREFDPQPRVVQLVVIFNAFWLEKLTGCHGFAYPSVVVVG